MIVKIWYIKKCWVWYMPLNNHGVERSIFIYASFFTIIYMSKLLKGVNVDNINIISKLIDIDAAFIDSINLINEDNRYIFIIYLKRIIIECPYCHSKHIIIKDNIVRDRECKINCACQSARS